MYGSDDGGFLRRETAFEKHISGDDERGFNVDGCFYCGGDHPSDCCSDRFAKDEYWELYEPGMEIDQ